MLKATKPDTKQKRLKIFIYGEAGVGKTVAALQFPDSYIIDTEKGTDFYGELIKKNNSVVLQTNFIDEIKSDIKELLITKHNYRTLIIDPITQIYNAVQEKWTRIFEKSTSDKNKSEIQDFGMRYWGKVKGDYKAIQRMLLALDMNIIVTAHQKDVYGTGFNKLGVTFDSMRGDDYFFDYIFRIDRKGKERIATTVKERAVPGTNKFPDDFVWSYDNFLKFYGQEIIEREANPVAMATKEQVDRLMQLIEIVKVDDSELEKWLNKADVTTFDEMNSETIQKCIDYLDKKADEIRSYLKRDDLREKLEASQPKEKKGAKK